MQRGNFMVKMRKTIHRSIFFRVMQQRGNGISTRIRILFDADGTVEARLDFAG